MRQRKFSDYAAYEQELEMQNIVYEPMTWSVFGRPHAATTKVLVTLSRRTARRRGLVQPQVLYRRTTAAITVEIWRRAALMSFACWPREAELLEED